MRIKPMAIMIFVCILSCTLIPSVQPQAAAIGERDISAVNAILMEQGSGRVLFEKDAHEKKKIASITKIMTAILAIESGKMDETVRVSGNAFGTEGSSLFLQQGQKMKLEDLVYGLMLRSGNDAAVAIAEHVGGSLDGFVWMMNQKAGEIGMQNSSFTNPHGLDNTPDHFSTAYDMALLTRYAMNNAKFAEISGTAQHRAPNELEGWDYIWKNKNKMLKLYKYSTGGKTGFTKLARRTLVSTAEKDGVSLIAVTLNASSDWDDHMKLFDYAFDHYDLPVILKSGKMKGIKHSFYKNKVYLRDDYTYPLLKEERDGLEIDVKLLKPKKGWKKNREDMPQIVGKAYIKLDGKVIGQRNLFYGKIPKEHKPGFIQSWTSSFMLITRLKDHG
ncbi:MAG: D-alanyl-D-alanine carboxypeptidase family protein [Bacillus sp. (in: firmicutes)]